MSKENNKNIAVSLNTQFEKWPFVALKFNVSEFHIVRQWLLDSLTGDCHIVRYRDVMHNNTRIYFEKQEDILLFKLTWV